MDKNDKIVKNDDRVICPHCDKKIVPKLSTHAGVAISSLCPYCGGIVKQFVSNKMPLGFKILVTIILTLLIISFLGR